MFKSSKRAFSRERRLSKIGGVASLGSSPSMQESFELETIAQLPSVRLRPTGDFAYSDAPTASTIPIRATANARIRAASLLWPPEVFGSASTRTIPIDSRLQQNSKASSTSALSGSRREAQEVSPRVANSQSSLRAVSGPVFDLMTAAWYTVASHATLPQSVEKLSGKVLDTVSEGRKAIEEVIEENGLSTQSTVPLRKPRYKPGKLDPSKIQIPLRPAPCSLSLDTNAPDSDWISNSGSAPYLDGITSAEIESVATAKHTLEACQISEISAWRKQQRSNAEIAQMLENLRLLPLTYAHGVLDAAEHRAAVDLLCWNFHQQPDEDLKVSCGVRVESLIEEFVELNKVHRILDWTDCCGIHGRSEPDMFKTTNLIPKDASPGEPSRYLRLRFWKGVEFWKEYELPYSKFQQIQWAFETTYQSIKELLRAGTWNELLLEILRDANSVKGLLPRWRGSKHFEANATPREVCQYYDSLASNHPDPSAYTPLLSELFFALQKKKKVKVPLSSNPERAWAHRDKGAFKLPRTHRFAADEIVSVDPSVQIPSSEPSTFR